MSWCRRRAALLGNFRSPCPTPSSIRPSHFRFLPLVSLDAFLAFLAGFWPARQIGWRLAAFAISPTYMHVQSNQTLSAHKGSDASESLIWRSPAELLDKGNDGSLNYHTGSQILNEMECPTCGNSVADWKGHLRKAHSAGQASFWDCTVCSYRVRLTLTTLPLAPFASHRSTQAESFNAMAKHLLVSQHEVSGVVKSDRSARGLVAALAHAVKAGTSSVLPTPVRWVQPPQLGTGKGSESGGKGPNLLVLDRKRDCGGCGRSVCVYSQQGMLARYQLRQHCLSGEHSLTFQGPFIGPPTTRLVLQ